MRIYLASKSPRRREILTRIGVSFDTLLVRDGQPSDFQVDETVLSGETASVYVERVARAKAEHGARLMVWRRLPAHPVLAADTTLELDGEIIGKPSNDSNAEAILRRLSGNTHRVLTGVAVHAQGRTEYALSSSEVRFRPLDEAEIRHYVLSGDPMDKAGAYGIQGRAAIFVEHLSGSHTGVMGLPACETAQLLKRFGFRF